MKVKLANVFGAVEQQVVKADVGRVLLQHGSRHGLAIEPLLQIIEGRDHTIAHHQKLAVGHTVKPHEAIGDVRESR
jgi:hypothetical protein